MNTKYMVTLQLRYTSVMASQITNNSSACWTACSGSHQRETSKPGIIDHLYMEYTDGQWVGSPYKWTVMRKLFPFHDVIMK